jgi:hypothetical protein
LDAAVGPSPQVESQVGRFRTENFCQTRQELRKHLSKELIVTGSKSRRDPISVKQRVLRCETVVRERADEYLNEVCLKDESQGNPREESLQGL